MGALAELDLQVAKGRLAIAIRATRPLLRSFDMRAPGQPALHLVEARHPLLGSEAVPLSFDLGLEFDVLIITGPNTGGKTVALKTIGLLALMAQAGLQLPAAEGCIVSVFRSVHADVGDEQSIEQSLSTFSSHVSRIIEMLRDADDRSLVLLDELGAGTDPQEGSALARAILEHLRQRRVLCVATTHYSDLKLYAHAASRVENASVEFDPSTLSPTYRLLVGLPGRSNALEIAARLGVPNVILQRARAALDPAEVQAGELLDQIQQERRAAEQERSLATEQRESVAKERARLEENLSELELARQKIWRQAEQTSQKLLAELRGEVAALRAEAKRSASQSLLDLERLADQAEALQPISVPADARSLQTQAAATQVPGDDAGQAQVGPVLEMGAEVLVPSLGVIGTIIRLDSDEAEVDVRGMRVRLKTDELAQATLRPARHEPAADTGEGMTRVLLKGLDQPPPLELDLRGQPRDEAARELDVYLNDAYLAGLRSVRIIHGKGTGAVRQAVRELLADHALVRRYGTAPQEAGGDGATEVELVPS